MKKNLSYIDSVHRDGRIWNITVMLLLIAFPLTVAVLFNATPDWGALLVGLIATAPMYWAVGVIETDLRLSGLCVLRYFPAVGTCGGLQRHLRSDPRVYHGRIRCCDGGSRSFDAQAQTEVAGRLRAAHQSGAGHGRRYPHYRMAGIRRYIL